MSEPPSPKLMCAIADSVVLKVDRAKSGRWRSMSLARVPRVGDVVGVLGHSGSFWVSGVVEPGHTAVLRLIGREAYKKSGIPWGVLIYQDDVVKMEAVLKASLTRIRDMAGQSQVRHEDHLQGLKKVKGAVVMGSPSSPRKTMTMAHTRLAEEALAEFNELSGILRARS
jgi:hypothetical protein